MSPDDADQQRGAANRLYWESDASVAEIAEKLGLSRRALYEAVRPEPAGERCPACRTSLVFRTRTARMLGEAECPECGLEHDIEMLREATAEAGPAMRRAADEREADEGETAEVEAAGTTEAVTEPASTDRAAGERASESERVEREPVDRGSVAREPVERGAAGRVREDPASAGHRGLDEADGAPGSGEGRREPDPRLRERAAWLGGAALAGVIIGAITAWFASRR